MAGTLNGKKELIREVSIKLKATMQDELINILFSWINIKKLFNLIIKLCQCTKNIFPVNPFLNIAQLDLKI